MKKPGTVESNGMRRSYRTSDFPGGLTRGKYASRAAAGSNVLRLDADIAKATPTSASGSKALGQLIRLQKARRIKTAKRK